MYFQCLSPVFLVKLPRCSKSTLTVKLMLFFEDKAIFICKKRSSPRPFKYTSVLDLSLHSEAYRETAPGVQGSPGCVTGTVWNMSDLLPSDLPVLVSWLPPQIKSYLALSKDVKVCSTHYEHLFKIFNINPFVVGTCFEICLLATSELFTVNHIWIEMKELHLTWERKIHTTCVYKATHYRWLLWW